VRRGAEEGEAMLQMLQGMKPSRCIIPLERAVEHVVCELFWRFVFVVPWYNTQRNEPRGRGTRLYTPLREKALGTRRRKRRSKMHAGAEGETYLQRHQNLSQ